MADCFFVTGEASGDAVAAGVIRHLRAACPDLVAGGIGSSQMAAAGVALWADSREWAAMGIVQSVPVGVRLLSVLRALKRHLAAERPRVLILVDFGAFNVRLGRWAVEQGISTVYLMPPGSWRREGRPKSIAKMQRSANVFLSPYAWNAEILKAAGLQVEHIGHPVLELSAPTEYVNELKAGRPSGGGRLIALLPGSRRHEVRAMAPLLVKVAEQWPHRNDRFLLVRAGTFTESEFSQYVGAVGPSLQDRLTVVDGHAADVFHASDLAVLCAGTATLEGAVACTPMVVIYAGPWLMHVEWQLRKGGLNAPMVAMPNILAGREIVRELVDTEATVDNIVSAARDLAEDPVRYAEAKRNLESVRNDLLPEGAMETAAARIAALLREPHAA